MKNKLRYYFKIFFISIIVLIVSLLAINYSLILYGIGQLKGQLTIINNSRSIDEMLVDPAVSDSVKNQLKYIDEVKKFAIDSLGLKATKNYTTFYDQHNKPILWVLTASDPYKIKAYEWSFPMLGRVSYKGYFDYDKGLEAETEMKNNGYDTDYDDVSAWSTLGWFKDPVLSSMLLRGKGHLAELIIHEMTHATLYLKSNVDINENLASVCGEQGAARFLAAKYGNDSKELKDYLFKKDDYILFSNHMLRGAQHLDSVYQTINDSVVIYKEKVKEKMINEIVVSLETIPFHFPKTFVNVYKKKLPNNAYFLNFIRYDAQKDKMKMDLMNKFNGNIRKYIDSFRES